MESTEGHAVLVDVFCGDQCELIFDEIGNLLIELIQFEEAACAIGDSDDSFGEVEALRNQLLEFVGLYGLSDCDFGELSSELKIDLIHLTK